VKNGQPKLNLYIGKKINPLALPCSLRRMDFIPDVAMSSSVLLSASSSFSGPMLYQHCPLQLSGMLVPPEVSAEVDPPHMYLPLIFLGGETLGRPVSKRKNQVENSLPYSRLFLSFWIDLSSFSLSSTSSSYQDHFPILSERWCSRISGWTALSSQNELSLFARFLEVSLSGRTFGRRVSQRI